MSKFTMIKRGKIEYEILDLPKLGLYDLAFNFKIGSNIEAYLQETTDFENPFGITHLIEHLLFKTSKTLDAKVIEATLRNNGKFNAFTNVNDLCVYFETLQTNKVLANNVCSEVILNDLKNVTEEEFNIVKDTVISEANQMRANDVNEFFLKVANHFYNDHKDNDIYGGVERLKEFTLAECIKVKDLIVKSNNLTVTIIYDSTIDSLENIVDAIESSLRKQDAFDSIGIDPSYREWLSKRPIINEVLEIPSHTPRKKIYLETDKQCKLFHNMPVAAYLTKLSDTSLKEIVREKYGLTYSISLNYKQNNNDNYTYYLNTDCDPEKFDLIMEQILKSLTDTYNGFTENEFNKVRDYVILEERLALHESKRASLLFNLFDTCTKEEIDELLKDYNENYLNYDLIFDKYVTFDSFKTELLEVVTTFKQNNYRLATTLQK